MTEKQRALALVKLECVEARIIVEAAPIARRFIGQPFRNLSAWIASFGSWNLAKIDG